MNVTYPFSKCVMIHWTLSIPFKTRFFILEKWKEVFKHENACVTRVPPCVRGGVSCVSFRVVVGDGTPMTPDMLPLACGPRWAIFKDSISQESILIRTKERHGQKRLNEQRKYKKREDPTSLGLLPLDVILWKPKTSFNLVILAKWTPF